MGALTQTQIDKEGAGTRNIEYQMFGYLRFAFWVVAGIIGFLQIWLQDRIIWADSLSYMDSGDMLWQGDFANAITNHWSPGLPFLLGLALKILHPIGLWEVGVVKLVDVMIFLCTLGCFDFLVNQFCRYHERSVGSEYLDLEQAINEKPPLSPSERFQRIWNSN